MASFVEDDNKSAISVKGIEQSFSKFFNSQQSEKGAKIVKSHHHILRIDLINNITSNRITFKNYITKILIIVLF